MLRPAQQTYVLIDMQFDSTNARLLARFPDGLLHCLLYLHDIGHGEACSMSANAKQVACCPDGFLCGPADLHDIGDEDGA